MQVKLQFERWISEGSSIEIRAAENSNDDQRNGRFRLQEVAATMSKLGDPQGDVLARGWADLEE